MIFGSFKEMGAHACRLAGLSSDDYTVVAEKIHFDTQSCSYCRIRPRRVSSLVKRPG